MSLDLAVLIAFANFAFVASITPGPNNLMVLASGAAFGMRATLPHIAGIALGFAVMLSAVVLGLGAVLDQYPMIWSVLKWGGVIWLCYLAWQLARPALFWTPSTGTAASEAQKARPMTLIEAALFQWVNPKAWAMALAVTLAYSDIAAMAWQRALVMSLVFAAIAPLCNGTWLVAGRALRTLLANDVWGRIALLIMSALIVISALLIALDGRWS
ncbi:LysE family translocator [Marivita sp.]|uniref:LysE family translocator n=1 Tax=Marivita sp. TaxID=2003365 RepID=UPI0025C0558A|nr:LysE family translocator [Marivita sp.]